MRFKEMMPRLGAKYQIEIETISKPNKEYQTDEYFELDLPADPAVMVGEKILVEGSDVPEDKIDDSVKSRANRRHSKKLQMQGARILRNEAYIEVRRNDER